MSFHQRLKHERLAKGWTIEQLSQASGVTVHRLSMLERNLVDMVSDNLKNRLAETLGVDFEGPPSKLDSSTLSIDTPAHSAPSPAPVVPALPEPLALYLPLALQQQLESIAHAQGRSLHGEILARLEASLQNSDAPQVAAPQTPVAMSPPPANRSVIQLTEADLAHITEQVTRRLQARN